MINKKIHYVWMGRNKKSELVQQCIESWKENLIDFEIIEWNEDNFDVNQNRFIKEAYENKKWAFVSDYVRLYVLYQHGGIYLDTDVEILKPIDRFLLHSAFAGFESKSSIATCIIGAVNGHPWLNELLKYYENKSYFNENGTPNTTPNVVDITNRTVNRFGLVLNNKYQILNNDIHIYPKEYFSPSNYGDSEKAKRKSISVNSYCLHHFNGSWLTFLGKIKVMIKRILGDKLVRKIKMGFIKGR